MPTGPFRALGKWPVFEHDGSRPTRGPSASIHIVQATHEYVKYRRKDYQYNPPDAVLHHARIYYHSDGTYRINLGSYQHTHHKAK